MARSARDEVVVRFGGRLVSREELLAMFESAGPDEYIDCLSFVAGPADGPEDTVFFVLPLRLLPEFMTAEQ